VDRSGPTIGTTTTSIWKKHAKHHRDDDDDGDFDHHAGNCFFQPHDVRVITEYHGYAVVYNPRTQVVIDVMAVFGR